MAYFIDITERAARNYRRIYLSLDAEDSEQARAWFNRLERVVVQPVGWLEHLRNPSLTPQRNSKRVRRDAATALHPRAAQQNIQRTNDALLLSNQRCNRGAKRVTRHVRYLQRVEYDLLPFYDEMRPDIAVRRPERAGYNQRHNNAPAGGSKTV